MIGVYVITNEVTGEQYVGASWDVIARFQQHRNLLRRGRHSNKRLQAAWNAAGETAFRFEGLEAAPEHEDQKGIWMDKAEAQWQYKLDPAYNSNRRRNVYVDERIPMRAS